MTPSIIIFTLNISNLTWEFVSTILLNSYSTTDNEIILNKLNLLGLIYIEKWFGTGNIATSILFSDCNLWKNGYRYGLKEQLIDSFIIDEQTIINCVVEVDQNIGLEMDEQNQAIKSITGQVKQPQKRAKIVDAGDMENVFIITDIDNFRSIIKNTNNID